MVTLQITIDEHLFAEMNNVIKPLGLDLAQIIREALLAWLKQHEGRRFEQEWMTALKQNPNDASRVEEWFEAQAWSAS